MTWRYDRSNTQRSLNFLATRAGTSTRRQLTQWNRTHLWKETVKRDAAIRTLMTFRDGRLQLPEEQEVQSLVRQLNVFDPISDPVDWWVEETKPGRHRPVCALPPAVKARRKMIRDVLVASMVPGPHLVDIRRRGRDYVARNIKAALEQGFEYCFVGDLRDCFQSVDPDGLYRFLPLPETVIRSNLDTRHINFRYVMRGSSPRTHVTPSSPARLPMAGAGVSAQLEPRHTTPRGIVTGSPDSNIVLSWLFNGMLNDLPHGVVVYLYTDNVFVAARTVDDCRLMMELLARYFRDHPAGSFVLVGTDVVPASEGFDYLGYRFRKLPDGEVEIFIADDRVENVYDEFMEALQDDLENHEQTPRRAEAYLRRKASGYLSCTDLEYFVTDQVELAALYLQGHVDLDELQAGWPDEIFFVSEDRIGVDGQILRHANRRYRVA